VNISINTIIQQIFFIVLNCLLFFNAIEMVIENESYRKILVVIFSIAFINFIFYTTIKSRSLIRTVYVVISLIPIWMRGSPYLGINLMPNNFYYITLDVILFNVLSTLMVMALMIKPKIYLNEISKNMLVILSLILLGICINLASSSNISNELNLFIVNIFTPAFFLISLYVYSLQVSHQHRGVIVKSISNLYFMILLFMLIELLFKGGAIFQNPGMILENGLRIGSKINPDNYGATIISGGIRDLLYLAFLFSIYPIVGLIFVKREIIKNKTYFIMLGVSFLIVFGVHSKTPIVIFFLSLLLSSGVKKFLLNYLPIVTTFMMLFSEGLIQRVSNFYKSFLYIIDGSFSLSREIDSSAAGRIIGVIERYNELLLNQWIGLSSIKLIDNIVVYLFSIVGVAIGGLIIILTIRVWNDLNKYGRRLGIVILSYSMVTFNNLFGVGGWNSYLKYETSSEFIHVYGWLPSYSAGNVYVTLMLVYLVLINNKSNGYRD